MQSEAPQFQARLPLKLRGLLLLKLKPSDGLDQIEKAPPLGPREEVISALQDWVPGISFDAPGKGEVSAADHRLALDIGARDQVHAAVASAEGDTAIELLRSVLEREGWRAYAPQGGSVRRAGRAGSLRAAGRCAAARAALTDASRLASAVSELATSDPLSAGRC